MMALVGSDRFLQVATGAKKVISGLRRLLQVWKRYFLVLAGS